MKKNTQYIIIAVLIILQVISCLQINSMRTRMDQLTNDISAVRSNVNNVISGLDSLYSNIDEKLEEQASPIEDVEIEIGLINKENLTVPITYTVIPKEVSDNTSISLVFDKETKTMQRSGSSFNLTVPADIFGEGLYPYLVISENDIAKIEKDDSLSIDNIKDKVYPHLYIHLMGLGHLNGKSYVRTGTIESDMKPPEFSKEAIEFTEARLLIKVDDSIIKDEPIDIANLYSFQIDKTIPLEVGQTCTMTVIVKDSIDLEHHYIIDTFTNGAYIKDKINNVNIYSQDGTLLWPKEF